MIEQVLPINDETYVVIRTSRVSLIEADLFIQVAFKNINNPTDEFVLDVSILRAMQYRPSTLWVNGNLKGIISTEQVKKLTNGQFELIQAKYRIDPVSLVTHESNKKQTIVPTIMLNNDQVMFQSVELMFATYGAHELIQDLIKHTPDEVLEKHCKEGYATLAFNTSPYETFLKRAAWNHNTFAYSLIANIRHNKVTYNKVSALNMQFYASAGKPFLPTPRPWQNEPFTLEGYILKNRTNKDEYLWSITGASVDTSNTINQLVDYPIPEGDDNGQKNKSVKTRVFMPVEPVIIDASPGRNDGEFATPFKTDLIGSTPIVVTVPVPKEKSSSGGSGTQLDAEGSSIGSGNDPYGSNRGVASIITGTSQNDFFSDNMRLLVVAARRLVPSKFKSIEWVVNHSCGLVAEPVCLYFEKTDENKDWVVVAKRDNEESYRFVLLFKFNFNTGMPVYMLELDSEQACCVLFFRLNNEINLAVLNRIMHIIASKKGVMRHVRNDAELAKLGVFKDKKHWTMLDAKVDKEEWIQHVADWLEERIDFLNNFSF